MTHEISQQIYPPFYVKDCALASIAIGSKAQNLGEFLDRIKTVPAESIYYHFWRQSIETSLTPGSFYNDFSHWAHYQLHDDILAERLALIDPTAFTDLEMLRSTIVEIIENRLDEEDSVTFYLHTDAFHFIKSKIVVFNTPYKMEHPKDLVKTIPIISHSSIFYHFIDARRREIIASDDFSSWLLSYKEEFISLIKMFKQIDPYFISLTDLQKKLSLTVTEYFLNNNKGF